MLKRPLTLVIPFYNEQNYLPRLLLSLEKQPAQYLNLIFVDNNSNDTSCQIVQKFATQHPMFHVILLHEFKQGIQFTRKKGLDYALRSGASILAGTDAD